MSAIMFLGKMVNGELSITPISENLTFSLINYARIIHDMFGVKVGLMGICRLSILNYTNDREQVEQCIQQTYLASQGSIEKDKLIAYGNAHTRFETLEDMLKFLKIITKWIIRSYRLGYTYLYIDRYHIQGPRGDELAELFIKPWATQ